MNRVVQCFSYNTCILHKFIVYNFSLFNRYIPRKSKDQTLPIGRIGNPCSMDHPKDHSLFGLGLPVYIYIYSMFEIMHVANDPMPEALALNEASEE